MSLMWGIKPSCHTVAGEISSGYMNISAMKIVVQLSLETNCIRAYLSLGHMGFNEEEEGKAKLLFSILAVTVIAWLEHLKKELDLIYILSISLNLLIRLALYTQAIYVIRPYCENLHFC